MHTLIIIKTVTIIQSILDVVTNAYIIGLSVLLILLMMISFMLIQNIRKLKAKVQESENFYELQRTFIDADSSLIYLKDENLKYVFVNHAFEQFYNLQEKDIIGYDDFYLSTDEFAQLRRKTDLDVMRQNKIVVDEVRWQDKVYLTTKFPVKLLSGVYGVGAYIKEVTEEHNIRRRNEKALFRTSILVDVLNQNYQSTKQQLDHVISESLKLTESEFGFIYIYNTEARTFNLGSWSITGGIQNIDTARAKALKLESNGLWGESVLQRRSIIVNDLELPNLKKEEIDQPQLLVSKYMTVPLLMDDRVIAVIGLANKKYDYDELDKYQINLLMKGLWNAKERREKSLELESVNKELKENELRLQLILDSTYEGIYGIDLDGNCTFCNNSCLEILKYNHQDELLGKDMHNQIHHSRRDGTPLPIEECRIVKTFINGKGEHVEDEVFWKSDDTCFDVEYFSFPQYRDGRLVGAVVTFMDITSRKNAERDITYLSYHDALTGLYNRRFFEEELRRLDTERNLPISIIMGDVNGLKLTNDIFGHASGDLLLKKAAEAMTSSCRQDDIIARWGGDEFVILLPKTENNDAEKLARRIKDLFSSELINAMECSISLGCVTKESIEESILETLEHAEDNMYSQKTLNKKQINNKTIMRITKTLHERNSKEGAHAKNVSHYCEMIGRAIDLTESEVKIVKDAGFLHDIGKIVLKNSLLDKTELLSDEDWQELKQHPVVGYRILNSSDETVELAKYVLSHHERWDGTGYPKGLKGEDIPKLSRVISLAESYDELISGSIYKQPIGKEKAILEIEANSGGQFDPIIALEFVKLLKQESLN